MAALYTRSATITSLPVSLRSKRLGIPRRSPAAGNRRGIASRRCAGGVCGERDAVCGSPSSRIFPSRSSQWAAAIAVVAALLVDFFGKKLGKAK